jgi:hypothetical protein
MSVDDEDLQAFLVGFGFSQEELSSVMDELDACRSIPGTTLRKYLNRIIETIPDESRQALLKGIIVGVAIRNAVDALEEPDATEEEKRIDREIERLRCGR